MRQAGNIMKLRQLFLTLSVTVIALLAPARGADEAQPQRRVLEMTFYTEPTHGLPLHSCQIFAYEGQKARNGVSNAKFEKGVQVAEATLKVDFELVANLVGDDVTVAITSFRKVDGKEQATPLPPVKTKLGTPGEFSCAGESFKVLVVEGKPPAPKKTAKS
jgi:hypothetical protein